MSINELRSITTFIRTVELGSLSRAAAAQQISPQAASNKRAGNKVRIGRVVRIKSSSFGKRTMRIVMQSAAAFYLCRIIR